MAVWSRVVLAFVFAASLCGPALGQTSPATQATEQQIYEKFRAWRTKQPPAPQPEILESYRALLAGEGVAAVDIDRQLRVITEEGQRLEIDRWNRILTAPAPLFNTRPNAFLVEMTKDLHPGKALDVGMGQGRNAIYLAQQGWEVTGFDPAAKAVAAAQDQARVLGVKLNTVVMRDDEFTFGTGQWDLIVLSYVGTRSLVPRVYEALRPGGLVIVEGFHRDATKTSSIGGGVVFDTNELLTLFSRFRVVRYEDSEGVGDFGLQKTRLVRLAAQKP
jgi:SAM-dependent methyltransferase